jgi:hypothetical protein
MAHRGARLWPGSFTLRTVPLALALTVLVALGGCSNPLADDPVLDGGPSRSLAERPSELADVRGGSTSDAGATPGGGGTPGAADDDGPADGGSAGDGGGSDPDPGGSHTDGSVPVRRTRVSVDDRSGDHGLRAPDHADIAALELEDRGDALRLTLTMAGEIPQRLPEGEVQGMGIDVHRPSRGESSYQVFVDGSADGWFAYFSTPQGFRKYPGSFGLGGPRMVFEVPWSALKLGGRFSFDSFCDWTRKTTGVVNLFAEDHAPDRSRATFRR